MQPRPTHPHPAKADTQGFLNFLIPVAFSALLLLTAAFLLYDQHSTWLTNPVLCHGDCRSYKTIAIQGYWYAEGARSNTNFFPLFPYLWRWSSLGEWGISFVNLLFFLSGTFLLFQKFQASWRVKILALVLSCLVFVMVPYSEAIFYLASVLLLIGLKENRNLLIYASLTALCLARPVSILFVPAWLFIAVLKCLKTRSLKSCIPYIAYSAYGLMVIGVVFIFQYVRTGEWLAFVKAQKVWGTWLRYPHLPFGAWGDDRHLVFAQYAVLICFFACGFLTRIFFTQISCREKRDTPPDEVLFSMLYLAGNALFPLLMRGGEYSSLNRYILATPFLYIFLSTLAGYKFTRVEIIASVLAIAAFLLIGWAMYTTPERIVLGILMMLCSLTVPWLLQSQSKLAVAGIVIAVVAGIYLQAVQLVDMVNGFWVG